MHLSIDVHMGLNQDLNFPSASQYQQLMFFQMQPCDADAAQSRLMDNLD